MVLARLIRLVTDRGRPENDEAPELVVLASPELDLLDRYVREVSARDRHAWNVRPADFETGRAILDADRALQPEIVCQAIKRLVSLVEAHQYGSDRRALEEIVTSLCRHRLDYEAEDLQQA